jgi:hypothetical protein
MPALARRPPVRALYSAPDGYEDYPFTWAYDGTILTDGQNALNQFVYIQGGWGDFIMRRCAGLGSVVNPAGGSFLLRDSQNRPLASDPVLIGSVNDDLMFPNEVPYRETTKISFDLYNVLRDPPSVLVGEIVNDVTGWRFPNATGLALAGPFSNGPNLYVVFAEGSFAGAQPAVRTFKSINGGVTWTEMNSAGAPTTTASLKSYAACQSGSKLFISWQKLVAGTYQLQMVVFDMSVDTYGANVAGPGTGLGAFSNFTNGGYNDNNYQIVLTDTGDGSIAVAYASVAGGTLIQTSFATFTIATSLWGATQVLATSATIDQVPAGIYADDPADRIYVILLRVNAAGVISLQVVVLSSAFAILSGPSLVSAACLQPGAGTLACRAVFGGFADSVNGQIVVGRVNAAGHVAISVAPFANAPVWTDHDSTAVAMTDNFSPANEGQLAQALPDAGNVTVLYYDDGTGAGNQDANLKQVTYNVPTATWGVPVNLITNAVAGLGGAISQVALSASAGSIRFALSESSAFVGVGAVFGMALPKVLQTQIAFQGVRRVRRTGASPADDSCDYDEPSFTYVLTGTISDLGPAKTPSAILVQTINDYDFDLYQVILTYQAASALPGVVCSVQIFDSAHMRISNIPVLDIFINGQQSSKYKNGALVPPLRYRQSTTLRIELYSLTNVVPVTVTVHLVGRQRYPKGALRNTA